MLKYTVIPFLLLCGFAQAQTPLVKSVEFDLKDDYVNEKVIACTKNGIILESTKNKMVKGNYVRRYQYFNQELIEENSVDISLPNKLTTAARVDSDSMTHMVYQNRKGIIKIVNLDNTTLAFNEINSQIPKKSYIHSVEVFKDILYCQVSTKNKPFIQTINWKTGEKRIVPVLIDGYKIGQLNILNIQPSTASNEVYVYIKASSKSNNDMYIMVLNELGLKKELIKLPKKNDFRYVDIRLSYQDKNNYILTGTYSENSDYYAQGMFFAELKNNKVSYIEYYPFSQFENFYSYLSPKKQEKIERKKSTKERKGKKYIASCRMVIHDPVHVTDGYILLAEVFYPTYRTETTTSYMNGRTVTTTRQVFDGYQYTHGVLSKFDNKGIKVWDNIFEMNAFHKPYKAVEMIRIQKDEKQNINLIFASYSTIQSKSFAVDGTIINDFKSSKIETAYGKDEILRANSNVKHWYDNYFIIYGSAKIKNTEEQAENAKRSKRSVFYLNKIAY